MDRGRHFDVPCRLEADDGVRVEWVSVLGQGKDAKEGIFRDSGDVFIKKREAAGRQTHRHSHSTLQAVALQGRTVGGLPGDLA